jgi:excisionase family DNA binding protein
MKKFFSLPECAELLGVGRTTVFALVRAGEIGTVTIGTRRLVPSPELTAYSNRLMANNALSTRFVDEISDTSGEGVPVGA